MGLLKEPAAAQSVTVPQAAPAEAGQHLAALAGQATTGIPHLSPADRVVPAPAPQPRRRGIGWGVITATLVASAVIAGGATAAAVWLTSDRSAAQPHTVRATSDAVPEGAGTPAPPSASDPAPPSGPSTDPSGSDVPESASPTSPEDIATEVQSLLEENDPLRARVGSAIATAKNCTEESSSVRDARDGLEDVAETRDDFVRRIGLLTPQADGDLAEALDDLSRAWTASAEADRAYASWATDIVDSVDAYGVAGCGHGQVPGEDYEAAPHNRDASRAKKAFTKVWNPIALRYGLAEADPDRI